MPVDLSFELSYLLGDALGRELELDSVELDPSTGRLCVKPRGAPGKACIEVRSCKGLGEAKATRCVAKTLAKDEALLRRLAGEVEKLLQAARS